jgi:hypothetical protein
MLQGAGVERRDDRGLDVAERRVDRLERGMARRFATGAGDDGLMGAAGIDNAPEAAQPICKSRSNTPSQKRLICLVAPD